MRFWDYNDCTSQARLDGKTAIVTGSNQGIGQYTAKDFYIRGCRVIMACRNPKKAQDAKDEIIREVGEKDGLGELDISYNVDLSSMNSIRKFAEAIMKGESQINILVNNAGLGGVQGRTEDGIDITMGINFFGSYLLTLLLLPRLIKSAPARIVNVTSLMYIIRSLPLDDITMTKYSYLAMHTYCASKVAIILFTKELAARLKGTGVTVYAAHPGFMATKLVENLRMDLRFFLWLLAWPFYTTVAKGAQTQIHCAVDESVASESGNYYSSCQSKYVLPHASNPDSAAKLWTKSWNVVGLGSFDPFTPR